MSGPKSRALTYVPHSLNAHTIRLPYIRRSLKIGEYLLQAETIALCDASLFASLMFDEASNLQMVVPCLVELHNIIRLEFGTPQRSDVKLMVRLTLSDIDGTYHQLYRDKRTTTINYIMV
jgi:hypothetical protein